MAQQQQPPEIQNLSNFAPSPQQPIQPDKPQPQFPMTIAPDEPPIVPVPAPVQTVTPLERLSEEPAWIDCPFCKRRTQTRVRKDDSSSTLLASLLCCLVCICFACIPQMAGWAQDTSHTCSNCGKQVAFKPHDGTTQPQRPKEHDQVVSQYAPVSAPPTAYQQNATG